MNHKFQPSLGRIGCAVCGYKVLDHTNQAVCEHCSTVGLCEVVNKILLCHECASKEVPVESTVEPAKQSQLEKLETINSQIQRVSIREELVRGNINNYTDFFNAKTASIVELEALVNADPEITDKYYHLAGMLKERIKYLTKTLFDARSLELELSAEIKSIQQHMNGLIPKLRLELRKEFAENNVAYTPAEVPAKIPKVKLSVEDKLAESYARMMKIPIEQAKKLLANKLRSECTCKATPGICKVHK